MSSLITTFLGLCLASVLTGCSFFATIFGAIALYGMNLFEKPLEAVISTGEISEQIGFGLLTGEYDMTKATVSSMDQRYPTDAFMIEYGDYNGYTAADGTFVSQDSLTPAGMEAGVTKNYSNVWGRIHAGALLGGEETTDYKAYFVNSVMGLDPRNFILRNDVSVDASVYCENYYYRDAAMGMDYTLELYYSNDRTGVLYLCYEKNYTLSSESLSDRVKYTSFNADQSYARNPDITGFVNSGSGSVLFSAEAYEGAWDSGRVEIDGVEYNLHAENLRALEIAGVMPFAEEYLEMKYETPTRGGSKEVPFLFGRRVITLKLEFSSVTDAVLRDARVVGFKTEIANNQVTDEEMVKGSYGIHPNGPVVSEKDFVEAYFSGVPYVATFGGVTHYYTPDGREITAELYDKIRSGETVSEAEVAQAAQLISGQEVVQNGPETAETDEGANTTDEGEQAQDGAENGDSGAENVGNESGDAETPSELAEGGQEDGSAVSENVAETASENGVSETEIAVMPTTGDGGFTGGFAESGNSDEGAETTDLSGDWFVIGGLHTEVTLASLESYLQVNSVSHTTAGSGNKVTYTAMQGVAKMTFVLEKSTTISSMEVWYENGGKN